MFVPVTRIVTILMAGVLCFGLLVPLALARHNVALVVALGVSYVVYLIINLLLWKRMRDQV